MANLYADLPVKKNGNGDPVWDEDMPHGEPLVKKNDELRWRLVSFDFTTAQLADMQFKIDDVTWNKKDPEYLKAHPGAAKTCPHHQPYPLKGRRGAVDWSQNLVKETKIRQTSGGFPKTSGTRKCNCEFHPYKAVASVRWKASKKPGNNHVGVIDPHVRWHKEG